jgi:hypothetical protein
MNIDREAISFYLGIAFGALITAAIFLMFMS